MNLATARQALGTSRHRLPPPLAPGPLPLLPPAPTAKPHTSPSIAQRRPKHSLLRAEPAPPSHQAGPDHRAAVGAAPTQPPGGTEQRPNGSPKGGYGTAGKQQGEGKRSTMGTETPDPAASPGCCLHPAPTGRGRNAGAETTPGRPRRPGQAAPLPAYSEARTPPHLCPGRASAPSSAPGPPG